MEVAYRMFERWRQENFFKYMREEFLLDALIDYQIEPEDPTRTVPNPKRRALDQEIHATRAELARLEREYGAAAADNAEQRRPTMRGFKIAHGKLGKQLRTARARVAQLFEQRRDVPKRVEVRDFNEQAVVKLATERKHLTDIIKMVAYQAESDLLALLRPHYARADQEGRTLLHELFATRGSIVTHARPHRGARQNVRSCELELPPERMRRPALPFGNRYERQQDGAIGKIRMGDDILDSVENDGPGGRR